MFCAAWVGFAYPQTLVKDSAVPGGVLGGLAALVQSSGLVPGSKHNLRTRRYGRNGDARSLGETDNRLQYDAITLSQFQQGSPTARESASVSSPRQADVADPTGASRSTATCAKSGRLGTNRSAAHLTQGGATARSVCRRARNQCLQQHVARAQLAAVTPGRG